MSQSAACLQSKTEPKCKFSGGGGDESSCLVLFGAKLREARTGCRQQCDVCVPDEGKRLWLVPIKAIKQKTKPTSSASLGAQSEPMSERMNIIEGVTVVVNAFDVASPSRQTSIIFLCMYLLLLSIYPLSRCRVVSGWCTGAVPVVAASDVTIGTLAGTSEVDTAAAHTIQ